MKRLFLLTVTLLLGSAFLSACGSPEREATPNLTSPAAFQEAADTREAALRALDSLQRGALQRAFANLERYAFTRHVRTEQLNEEGRVTASESHVARHTAGDRVEVLGSDSSGAFDFGWLGRFAEGETVSPANLARHVLPDEPVFLSERNQYAFQYRLLGDTTLSGRSARVVALRAHPEEGDDQTLRSARLYLDRATGNVLAARLHRVRRSLFFDEDTRLFIRLRAASGARPQESAWVPAETRFQTDLRMPLRPDRRFRTTATYARYQRPA